MVALALEWLASLVKSRRRLQAENIVLRHKHSATAGASGRVRVSNIDRLAFVWLYRLCPAVVGVVTIVRPETLI
jgi:hypothetical protein